MTPLFSTFKKMEKKSRKSYLGKLTFLCFLHLLTFPSLAQTANTPDSILQNTEKESSGFEGLSVVSIDSSLEGRIVGSDPRVYERNTSYGLGWANVFDTYLSPQSYDGIEVRILRESMPAINNSSKYFDPYSPWLRQSVFQGFASYTEHPSDDNAAISLMGEWRWGYLYHFRSLPLPAGLELLAGGQIYGEGGLIYNMANGNNPVAMKLGAGAGLTGIVLWRFNTKKPLSLRYQFFAPVLGAFFSPHYGQSYYEIFSLGNSDGVVRFSSLHNKPSLWQQLSLDFQILKNNTLRFSYVADIRQSSVNDLKYHQWSHIFMLGLVHRFQKL